MFNKAVLLKKNETIGELIAKYRVICKEKTDEDGAYLKGGIDFNSVTDMEGETKYLMIYDQLLTDGNSACIVFYSGEDLDSARWAINENTGTKIRVNKLVDSYLYGTYGLFHNVQVGQEVIVALHA